MNRFPAIADLRLHIEGSEEEHSNSAWAALVVAVSGSKHAEVYFRDVIMAKAVLKVWGHWELVCRALTGAPNDIARSVLKRDFKIAYGEFYRQRDKLRKDVLAPVILKGPEPHEASTTHLPYDRITVEIAVDHQVRVNWVRMNTEPQKKTPMPDEVKQMLDEYTRNFGKLGVKYDRINTESPQNIDATRLGRNSDQYSCDGLYDTFTDQSLPTDPPVPNDAPEGNQADRNAISTTNGHQREHPLSYRLGRACRGCGALPGRECQPECVYEG